MIPPAGDVRPWTMHQGRVVLLKPLLGRVPHGGIYDAVAPLTSEPRLVALAPPPAVPLGPDEAILDPPAPPYVGLAVPHPPGEPLSLLPRPWPDNAARHLLADLVDLVLARRDRGLTGGWLQPELIGVDARGPRRPRVVGADLALLPFLASHGVAVEGPVVGRAFASPQVQHLGPETPAEEVWAICALGSWLITGEHPLRPGAQLVAGAPTHTYLQPWRASSYVLQRLMSRGLQADPADRIELAELADELSKPLTGWQRLIHIDPPLDPTDPPPQPSWRGDPRIMGRFSPAHPDDLQAIIHDGDPATSGTPIELAWVRVTRFCDSFYDGVLLTEPAAVRSVRQGQPVRFIMPRGQMPPVVASPAYLADMERWQIGRCTTCGSDEVLDPPGELLTTVVGALPDSRAVDTYVVPCAWCGSQGQRGRIVVSRRPQPGPDSPRPVSMRDITAPPQPPAAWWPDRVPDPADFPVGVPAGGGRFMIDERWGGTAVAGRFWGWDAHGRGVVVTTSREQRLLPGDIAEALALPVEGVAPLRDVVAVDRATPQGERLLAMVEHAPPGTPWDRAHMPPTLVGWTLAAVAEVVQRLVRGGYPLPTVALESVFIGDELAVQLTGRSDLFLHGALDAPHAGPETRRPLWSHLPYAPELVLSRHAAEVDEAATVWSLAVAGMVAATGRHPLGDGGLVQQVQVLASRRLELSPLDDVPADLAALLRAGLAVEPPTRPRLAAFATLRRPG